MSTLHTVNKSPFEHQTLNACCRVCLAGDGLLLIEDGVYGALPASPSAQQLRELQERGVKVFALREDTEARGLSQPLSEIIELTDYNGFVRLSTEHNTLQSWY